MKLQYASLWGVAVKYNVLAKSRYEDVIGQCRLYYKPGLFGESIRAVQAGEAEVKLLCDHDERREFASTRDGSLLLIPTADSLMWRVNPLVSRGRRALDRYAKLNPRLVHCSIRTTVDRWRYADDPDLVRDPRVEMMRGVVHEISLTNYPANPETAVYFQEPRGMTAAVPKSQPVRPSPPTRSTMATGIQENDLAALRLIAKFGARGLLRDVRGRLFKAGLIDGNAKLTAKGRGMLAGGGSYRPMLCTGGTHYRPSLCA